MPRGPQLTQEEKSKIDALNGINISISEIAKTLNRSRKLISNYIRSPNTYGTRKRSGRPLSYSPQDKNRLIRTVSNQPMSTSRLVEALDLSISSRTTRRILFDSPTLAYKKMMRTPMLLPRHMNKRVQWATEKVQQSDLFHCTIFSDEKKWNMDGPDGTKYIWQDLRKEPRSFFSRHSGGKSVMVWGAFSHDGKSELAFLEGNQDSEKYVYTLSEYLLPFAHRLHGTDFVFQHDNARIHTSQITKEFLSDQNINVMDWPALSPDLNPIENLWGILSRKVYADGKQYHSVQELKKAIIKEWEAISPETLQNLIKSMPNRCIEVLKRNGAKTTY